MMNGVYTQRGCADFRRRLLVTACVAAFGVTLSDRASAGLSDIGQFSLSAGGMWDQTQGDGTNWSAEKFLSKARPGFTIPQTKFLIAPPPVSWDYDAKISFEPANTAWVFSLSGRYGKSRIRHRTDTETFPTPQNGPGAAAVQQAAAPANGYGSYSGTVSHSETHMIADFEAGRDFGLGLWEGSGRSVLSLGARYVRFTGGTDVNFKTVTKYATQKGSKHIARGFTGVGPRLSWDGSAPLWRYIGLFIDAGADASLLFGRQTANIDTTYTAAAGYSHPRRKSVAVKNFGGFAALSWQPFHLGAKVSIGYRADLFFQALDGGDPTAHQIDRSFYGPFASIGIQTR